VGIACLPVVAMSALAASIISLYCVSWPEAFRHGESWSWCYSRGGCEDQFQGFLLVEGVFEESQYDSCI
jgi:hypothetical protein